MFPLAAAQVPGPQACAQALLTFSVAQKTLVPLPMERERAFSKVHAQEHHIPVIAGPSEVQCCVSGSAPVSSSKGFDISDLMSSSTASCFKNNGYTTVIARGWRSYGEVDKNGCSYL